MIGFLQKFFRISDGLRQYCIVSDNEQTKESQMSVELEGHEGRVVEVGPHETRMSDYSLFGMYAVFLKDDGSYEETAGNITASVDASPEMIEVYKAQKVAETALRLAKRKSEDLASEAVAKAAAAEKAEKAAARLAKNKALEAGIEVAKGDTVLIKSGKSKGSEGNVFWIGGGNAGTKLGVALGDEKDARGFHKNVAWVLKKNVKPVLVAA